LSQLKIFFSKRRNVIRLFAVALLAVGTYAQYMLKREAAPVVDSKLYGVTLTFTTPAGDSRLQVQAGEGSIFSTSKADGKEQLTASFQLTAAGPETVRLDGGFGCDGAKAKQPPFTARLGQPTAVRPPIGGSGPACELVVLVTKVAAAGQG
jgi:hypothetical protein